MFYASQVQLDLTQNFGSIFSCTFHIIHLIVCIFYNGSLPTITTWLLWIVSASLMTLGGEYLCLASEMKEIPVGYQSLNNNRIDL